MSVPIELSALAEHLGARGPVAYLVTVSPEGMPHVVSVSPRLVEGTVLVGAGRRTLANLAGHPSVTLLWPAAPGAGYSLILDGQAAAHPDAAEATIVVRPTAAVLHRTPEGDPSTPSCVTVLEAR